MASLAAIRQALKLGGEEAAMDCDEPLDEEVAKPEEHIVVNTGTQCGGETWCGH